MAEEQTQGQVPQPDPNQPSQAQGPQAARNWAGIFQTVLALIRALSQQAEAQGETEAAQALTEVCQATEQAQAKVQ